MAQMRLLLVMLLFSLAACDRSQNKAPVKVSDAPETLAPSFVSLVSAPNEDAMHFRITAPKSRSLYLENCNGAISWGLEHQQTNDWVPAWGAALDACHSAPMVIAPGTHRDFREVMVSQPGEPLPPPGPYRLAVYGLYFTHDSSDHFANIEAPHALRLSQPFTPATSVAP